MTSHKFGDFCGLFSYNSIESISKLIPPPCVTSFMVDPKSSEGRASLRLSEGKRLSLREKSAIVRPILKRVLRSSKIVSFSDCIRRQHYNAHLKNIVGYYKKVVQKLIF